jgi:hypothetical protein
VKPSSYEIHGAGGSPNKGRWPEAFSADASGGPFPKPRAPTDPGWVRSAPRKAARRESQERPAPFVWLVLLDPRQGRPSRAAMRPVECAVRAAPRQIPQRPQPGLTWRRSTPSGADPGDSGQPFARSSGRPRAVEGASHGKKHGPQGRSHYRSPEPTLAPEGRQPRRAGDSGTDEQSDSLEQI